MGIINAFVNQIGREAGRDAYRGIKNSSGSYSHKPNSGFNDQFLDKVSSFKRLPNDNDTLLNIVNYVEEAENISVENFDWFDIFAELDNKIEFCQRELPEGCQEKINLIDKQNALTFHKKLETHQLFIQEIISDIKVELSSKRNFLSGILFSFVFINPIYYKVSKDRIFMTFLVGMIIFGLSYLGFFFSFSSEAMKIPKQNTPEAMRAMKTLGVLFFSLAGILYLRIVYNGIKRCNLNNNSISAKEASLEYYTLYLSQLKNNRDLEN
jgi:hypothetical protein